MWYRLGTLCFVLVLPSLQAQDLVSAEQVEAIRQADRAIREDFFDPANHVRLAQAYRDAGADTMAFRLLHLAQYRHFSRLELTNAIRTVLRGEPPLEEPPTLEFQLAQAEAATTARPDDAGAWVDLGRLRLATSGHLRQAEEAARRAVELDADRGAAVALLATVLDRRGQSAPAIGLLREFLAAHPGDPDVATKLANLLRTRSTTDALAVLREALGHREDSARLHFAYAYLGAGVDGVDQDEVEAHFERASELEPDNAAIWAWHGRFLRSRDQKAEALHAYLQSYFLDPWVREEVEVYKIISSLIEDGVVSVLATVTTPKEALLHLQATNPVLVTQSWVQIMQHPGWNERLLELAFQQLTHDDEAVRYQAAGYIAQRAPPGYDRRIRQLLESEDAFVRGIACYIVLRRYGETAFADLREVLQSENEYLRYEALSALMEYGTSAARRVVLEHMRTEASPRLQQIFASVR